MIEQNLVDAAGELIKAANKIVVVTHISPDGDAMGSALAMTQFLQNQKGCEAVTMVTPNDFPSFLAWMPGADKVVKYDQQTELAEQLFAEADLIVCTDFNEPKRVGDALGKCLVATKAQKIMIDHHLYPADFPVVTMSYPQSPSASELVYHFICQLAGNQTVTLPIAECVYTGMMTDTGNFSFNSNYPDLYKIVSELVNLGVDKDAIYNKVFNTYSAERMRLMGYCLYMKMRLWKKCHVSLIAVSRKELLRFNFQSGDAEGLVNLPLQIGDIYYSVFMREDVDKIKISLRSQGDRPVNILAADLFNGGGHKNASGGEFYGKLEDAVALFEKNFQKYFNK